MEILVKKSWKNGDYLITMDKTDLKLNVIFNFLSNESYWSKVISKEDVIKSLNYPHLQAKACCGRGFLGHRT